MLLLSLLLSQLPLAFPSAQNVGQWTESLQQFMNSFKQISQIKEAVNDPCLEFISDLNILCFNKAVQDSFEYELIGSRVYKCATTDGKDPQHEWFDSVNGQSACEAKCELNTSCTGYSPSFRSCLIWKEDLTRDTAKLQKGEGFLGCYVRNKQAGNGCTERLLQGTKVKVASYSYGEEIDECPMW